ncbi:MAG: hypothetical protein WCI28_07485, partial [Opitutaceae bacterium]
MPEPPVAPAPEVVVVREVPSAPAPVAAPHVEMVSNTSAPAQAPDVAPAGQDNYDESQGGHYQQQGGGKFGRRGRGGKQFRGGGKW